MKKVYFFGTGYCAELFAGRAISSLEILGNFCVKGFLDNNASKVGTIFEGYKVYRPDILRTSSCDLVLLFLFEESNYEVVYKQLKEIISPELIQPYYFPLKVLVQKRYQNTSDIEIKQTLNYISKNKISVFNQFIKASYTYDEVKWDRHVNLPYIDFTTIEGKDVPMYFPSDYGFFKKGDKMYVENVMWEQSLGSPHLYVKKDHDVKDGDCIIDAGVCEGNFALKYIDIASHIYLFEMDPIWKIPLKYTFRNYEKKITFIDKAISNKTSKTTCRIDDIISNHKIDFIKMDIEGAELLAVQGANDTFCKNDLRASICCYHRHGDEGKIRLQLEEYGYSTSVSEGYMLFLYSDDTWKMGDLRRGIVYCDREK